MMTVVTVVFRDGRVEYVAGVERDNARYAPDGLTLDTDQATIEIVYKPRGDAPGRLDVLVRNPNLHGSGS